MLRLQFGVVDSRGGCRLLSSLVSAVCRFPLSSSLLTEFLVGRRCSNCGPGYFPLAALPLETAVESCSTSVYTPTSCFPFRTWWRFFLVSSVFWGVGVHFGLSQTDAGVRPDSQD
jgi:hypothetical protein